MEQNKVNTVARGVAVLKNDTEVLTAEVDVLGPAPAGRYSPCVIVRPGEDPEPTCVNPQCPKADNCRRHIRNRTDPRKPSIAIIPWRDCTHYDAIDPNNVRKD